MARTPGAFRQSDLTKAIRGAKKAGVPVERVEIDKAGKIVVFTSGKSDAATAERNDFDV